MEDLELYPRVDPLGTLRRGLTRLRSGWKRALAYSLVVMLVLGLAGYRWVTTVTPVDKTRAVELFRAERDANEEAAAGSETRARARTAQGSKKNGESQNRTRRASVVRSAARPTTVAAGSGTSDSDSKQRSTSGGRSSRWDPPEEGVYSWATDGYEEVSGARRRFPEETQRILTLNGDGHWTQHHYFSEEREIWTYFHWGERGAEITKQRNKVKFGPITNDSTLDFSPPMLVGPRALKVGSQWGDEWDSGATYGNYSSEIFEHTTLDIGGERVEVWGIAYEIVLHGEQEGKVIAKVWLAPDYSLTVQEYYDQNVESGGARYHGEWTVKLKSLHPEQ